mgnify:CR=1 FL=1
MSYVTITKSNFQELVLNNEKPVLLDFWAPWCGPCRMVSPLVDRIAEEVGGETYGRWIVQGVCFDFPFYVLEQRGIPCGKDLYYQMRRKFYYELSMKI